MKKLFLILFVACGLSVSSLSAQSTGTFAIGGHLGFGSEIESIGIGAHAQFNIMEFVRVAPSFTLFPGKADLWMFSADGHYLLPIAYNFVFYPIAGLNVSGWKFENMDSKTRFGLNVGAGLQYDLSFNLITNLEYRYQAITDYSQSLLTAGIAYRF